MIAVSGMFSQGDNTQFYNAISETEFEAEMMGEMARVKKEMAKNMPDLANLTPEEQEKLVGGFLNS